MVVRMATYREIQEFVKAKHGFSVKSCWIAHVKSDLGFPMRTSPRRRGPERMVPCPPEKRDVIIEAIRALS